MLGGIMDHVVVGEEYVVVIPAADDGGPDERKINRALGRPDCALDYEFSPLDHRRVHVYVAGLLTAGGEAAALVGCRDGSVRLMPVAWLAHEYPDRPNPLAAAWF
ncbi:hypothetical protein G1H11_12035 [Phytoactinopolyspora alkaliphila]|uniref:Uncharacterized protein n=1 Tax=Phytoactinopolyspora alkaliphila TaxID=1783498 RepID=A0A6N9YMF6_9ACTN|nr:hypothetical protein [Phytoactinopolyspora alkaliphila]NED96039.1 hypothetical protein [Phytoactinopolyspora alkaliphila]